MDTSLWDPGGDEPVSEDGRGAIKVRECSVIGSAWGETVAEELSKISSWKEHQRPLGAESE